MQKLDDQLKAAITAMPVKEKDKLLLRLVAKDQKLVERLIFELLEGGNTRDERAADLRKAIERQLPYSDAPDLTPGWLMMYLRSISGQITAHVNATKDKSGEVILTVYMLAEAIRRNADLMHKMSRRADTLAPYLVKRTAAILKKAEKIHEDYFIEFRKDLNEVLAFLHSYSRTKPFAEEFNLPQKWNR